MTSPKQGKTGIAIVEPLGILRASLRMVFEAERDLTVVGEAGTVQEARDLVGQLPSQTNVVLLVALELTGEEDAFSLIRATRDRSPSLTILATGTDLTRGGIAQSLFFGADGFIHKNSAPERFVEAARRAAGGELVLEGLPRGALGEIIDHMDHQRSSTPALTEREVQVLEAAADGLTAREIGRRLGVSERTVTTHLHHIYRKLDAAGRIAAIAAATRLGFLEPEPSRVGTLANQLA